MVANLLEKLTKKMVESTDDIMAEGILDKMQINIDCFNDSKNPPEVRQEAFNDLRLSLEDRKILGKVEKRSRQKLNALKLKRVLHVLKPLTPDETKEVKRLTALLGKISQAYKYHHLRTTPEERKKIIRSLEQTTSKRMQLAKRRDR